MTPMVVDVPLRWGDMDAQGHVNNAGILDYLQEARVDLLLSGDCAHLLGGGIVVVQHQVTYRRPIVFSENPVQVGVAPREVGAARFSVAYDVHHEGELCAQAVTTLCAFDFEAGTPRRLTDAERAWFSDRIAPIGPDLKPLATPRLDGRGVTTDLRVRWTDLDSYGHVNNVRYFDFIQEARIATTTQLDPSAARPGGEGVHDPERVLWLVARQDVDYIAQMGHRLEPYHVHTAPTHLGNSSMVIAAEIVDPLDDGRVLARGRTVLVRSDQHGRPVPLDERTRELMASALVE